MIAARMLRLCLLLLAPLVLAAGCQRQAALQTVNGKVTYKGAVLTNGIVVFTPDASRGDSGPIAVGTIREDGTFALSTGDLPGASPGWYRVTAFATAAPKGALPDRPQNSQPLLPENYRDPERSLLRCEIKPNQANAIDLNLD